MVAPWFIGSRVSRDPVKIDIYTVRHPVYTVVLVGGAARVRQWVLRAHLPAQGGQVPREAPVPRYTLK